MAADVEDGAEAAIEVEVRAAVAAGSTAAETATVVAAQEVEAARSVVAGGGAQGEGAGDSHLTAESSSCLASVRVKTMESALSPILDKCCKS